MFLSNLKITQMRSEMNEAKLEVVRKIVPPPSYGAVHGEHKFDNAAEGDPAAIKNGR